MTIAFNRNLQLSTLFFDNSIKRNFFSIISANEITKKITKKFTTNGIAHILNQPDIAFKRISIRDLICRKFLFIFALQHFAA